MAIPTDAAVWPDPMDPADLIDYLADLSPLLEAGESIASFTVAVMPEAVAIGVEIVTLAPRDPVLANANTAVKIWLNVPVDPEDVIFEGSGVNVGIVFTITTDSVPSRRRQRTYNLNVRQR